MPTLTLELDLASEALGGLSLELDLEAQALTRLVRGVDLVASTNDLLLGLDMLAEARASLALSLDLQAEVVASAFLEAVKTPGAPVTPDFYVWWNGTQKSLDQAFGGAQRVQVTRAVRSLTTWTVDLQDDSGEFDPSHPSSGWKDWLRPTPHPDASGEYRKKVVLRVTIGGQVCTLAVGPILGRNQAGSERQEDGWRHPLRGTDMGHKLTPAGKNLPTRLSRYGQPVTNHSVLQELLQAAHLEMDLSRLSVMPIPRWDCQNESLLGALERVMEACGGDWILRGETFVAWDPALKPKEQADWTYDLAVDAVQEVSIDESAVPIHNVIRVLRSRENGNLLAVGRGSGIGQHTVSFSKPAWHVSLGKRQAVGGVLSDFYVTDQAGNIVSTLDLRGPDPPITGSWPATGCTFTFGQGGPLDAGDSYVVEFLGRGADDPLFGGDFDEVLSREYRYQSSIDDHGELPHEIYDYLLPNESWMRNRADREFARSTGLAEKRAWRVPFNPLLEPGQTVRMRYPETGEDLALYVLEVVHSLDLSPADRWTTFSGVLSR